MKFRLRTAALTMTAGLAAAAALAACGTSHAGPSSSGPAQSANAVICSRIAGLTPALDAVLARA
jgi:hypothetical protein